MSFYALLLNKFSEVIFLVGDTLPKEDLDSTNTFVYVGEYVLALEALCSVLYEDKIHVSSKVYELLKEIGKMMALKKEEWEPIEQMIESIKNN